MAVSKDDFEELSSSALGNTAYTSNSVFHGHLAMLQQVLVSNHKRTVEIIAQAMRELHFDGEARAAKLRQENERLKELVKSANGQGTTTADFIQSTPNPRPPDEPVPTWVLPLEEPALSLPNTVHDNVSSVAQDHLLTNRDKNMMEPVLPLAHEPSKPLVLTNPSSNSLTSGSVRRVLSNSSERRSNSSERRAAKAINKDMVFPDSEKMIEIIQEHVSKPGYNVADYYWEAGICQAIARHAYFDITTTIVVSLNAIWFSIDVDHNEASSLVTADAVFQIVENLICLYFFVEWIIRFGAFRIKMDGLKDGWFLFDSVLAAAMVLETWLLNMYIYIRGSGGVDVGGAGSLKIFRMLRLTRTARMVRLLRMVPELMIIVRGIVVASRSVFFTLCFLFIIIYFFAVAFRQLTLDTALGDKYFSSVPSSISYLLLVGALPDQMDFIEDMASEHIVFGFLAGIFLMIAGVTVMNMLIGVLCEVVGVVATCEKEQVVASFVSDSLRTILIESTWDGMSPLSESDFKALLMNPKAINMMNEVGVDVVGLGELADFVLAEQGNEMTYGDLLKLILRLRGTNEATVRDLVDLRQFMFNQMEAIDKQLQNLFKDLECKISKAC